MYITVDFCEKAPNLSQIVCVGSLDVSAPQKTNFIHSSRKLTEREPGPCYPTNLLFSRNWADIGADCAMYIAADFCEKAPNLSQIVCVASLHVWDSQKTIVCIDRES